MQSRLSSVFLILILLLGLVAFLPSSAQALSCNYNSTQARVHRDINDSWKQSLTIQRGQSFEVGGFHNGTGQFANDVVIQVVGRGWSSFYGNGQKVQPPSAGVYTVYVNTSNQFGRGCSAQARVTVKETPSPTPTQACRYGSTQARVQQDVTQPWAQTITTTKSRGFNVGGFHDHTGQFGSDVILQVSGPGLNTLRSSNSARIAPPSTGWYKLRVSTNGQSGGGCEQEAWVLVN